MCCGQRPARCRAEPAARVQDDAGSDEQREEDELSDGAREEDERPAEEPQPWEAVFDAMAGTLDPNALLRARCSEQDVALWGSVERGELEAVDAALMSGANVSMTGGATGLLPLLHAAAALGHGEVVSRLIEAGAPVDARDGEGWTALQARVPLLTSRPLEPFLPPPCCPAAALQLRSAARAARCGRGAAAGGARLRTGLG